MLWQQAQKLMKLQRVALVLADAQPDELTLVVRSDSGSGLGTRATSWPWQRTAKGTLSRMVWRATRSDATFLGVGVGWAAISTQKDVWIQWIACVDDVGRKK